MQTTKQATKRPGIRIAHLVGVTAAVALAGVLLFSVWAKGLDPAGFAEQMVRDKMLPAGLAFPTAVLMVGIEAALAFALIAARRKITLFLSTVMMVGFFLLSLYQYLNPPEDPSSCGCFGNLLLQSPLQHMVVNGCFVLLAGLAWLSLDWPKKKFPAWRWLIPASGFLLGTALAFAAPQLPVDHLATQLRPGADLSRLRIDEIVPEVQSGRTLMLLIDRADEQTRLDTARINELIALDPESQVEVFALAEENEEMEIEFLWTAAPAFEVRGAPWGVLKPLYRTLPRAFLVIEGEVVNVWDEIPDEETLLKVAGGQAP